MKTALTIILIFFTTLSFGQTKDKYEKYMDSLLGINQYDELITFFETELKKYPKSEDVLRSLGYVHIVKKNLDLGEKYYLEALEVNPKCARCYMNIGRVYAMRNDNKKALEYINKSIITDPTDALLYSSRAKLKEFMVDKFGALRDHNKAIEIDSTNAQSYIERASYYSDGGYSELAISDLTKAIELSPNNHYPYFQRASEFFVQRNLEEALKDMNAALVLDSNQHSLYTGRGAVLAAMQEYEKAIKDYSKAISLNSSSFLPILNRASAYYKLEDIDASCSDYAILKTLIENGTITDQMYIKEINDAVQDFCDSSKPSYYYQRGIGFYNLKEYQKALDFYEKGNLIFPDNSMILSFKGNAHLALNDFEKAIVCYNQSLMNKENLLIEIKSNPRFTDVPAEDVTRFYEGTLASIYYSLSECKINLQQLDEALLDINSAIQLAPDIEGFNKESYYNLRGHIYLMKGKYEQAISDFNKSIQLNKDFALAYVNRAIAKVSLVENTTVSASSENGNDNTQAVIVHWDLPNKSSLKKSESALKSALSDCDTAIELEIKLGFAYYIRGQIKQMLKDDGYCIDLLKAKELGMIVETELLKDCLK